MTRDDPSQLNHAARVTSVSKHLEQSGGPQARILLESLLNELQVRVREVTSVSSPLEPVGLQGTAYRLTVQTQLRSNGSDFPVFGEEQTADLDHNFRRNHGWLLLGHVCIQTDTRPHKRQRGTNRRLGRVRRFDSRFQRRFKSFSFAIRNTLTDSLGASLG
jgi:hypothetical protein